MANLKLQNLYKMYDQGNGKKDGVYAVNNLNLEIEDGTFLGILGPSGCGKSTTLRMIAGLEEITKGEIAIGDMVINDIHPKERKIGLAFEDYALYPPLSVYNNIAFCLKANKVDKKEIDQRVRKIAKTMKVEELLDAKVEGLSGGQKQRVAALRALLLHPQIVLADEPTGALDSRSARSLMEQLSGVNREDEAAVLMVTHDAQAASFCSRILFIQDGKVFHELRKRVGEETNREFYERILSVMAQLGGGSNYVL